MADEWPRKRPFFKSASVSIQVLPMGRNPISGLVDVQVIKSIVAVDEVGDVYEWGNGKWERLGQVQPAN